MQRPRSHEIDEIAKRVFTDALPVGWIYNEQKTDYGKDYLVEVGTKNVLTGLSFFVQLKGKEHAKLDRRKKHTSFSLETKHAAYYADKVTVPVFLVVVDAEKRVGFWQFLQRTLLADRSWRKKKSVAVHVPVSNPITDTDALRLAVEKANAYMRTVHPGAIRDAIMGARERLERLDPRFRVQIRATEDKEQHTVLPRDNVEVAVQFSFHGPGDVMQAKLVNLIERGLPVEFGSNELKVSGSPLFETVFAPGGLMQWSHELAGTATLKLRDDRDDVVATLDSVPGTFTGGTKEHRFSGALPNSPFTLSFGPLAQGKSGTLNVTLTPAKWDEQPLLLLAYFDQLYSFHKALRNHQALEITCLAQGNQFASLRSVIPDLGAVEPVLDVLDFLAKARQIARQFSVNVPFRMSMLTADAIKEVNVLHAILYEGGYRETAPSARITGVADSDLRKIVAAHKGEFPETRTITDDGFTLPFLGQSIPVGRLEYHYDHLQLVESKRNRQKRKNAWRAVFQTTPKSEIRIQKANAAASPDVKS